MPLDNILSLYSSCFSFIPRSSCIFQMIKDEHQALGLAFSAMEDRYRKIQEENTDLITRWMQVKAKDADKLNTENDDQLR